MIPLASHLWQSTLVAALAAILAHLMRQNRASVRYLLWVAASAKFLLPFSLLVSLGSRFEWRRAPALPLLSTVVSPGEAFYGPVRIAAGPAAPAPAAPLDWLPAALLILWVIGTAAVLFSWWSRWQALRAALRSAKPLDLGIGIEARTSASFAEPGIVGVRRPILLLPEGIPDLLTPSQFQAILAHELCHVRRHDNLTSALHMAVEALFWFHPAVWWIGGRLLEERERACDEDVLRRGYTPEVYAEGILKICERCVESPLPCVSGVAGANLKKRIEAIMTKRAVLKLSLAKQMALTLTAAAALLLPLAIGVLNAPAIRAQSPDRPAAKFDVASIKACPDGAGGEGQANGKQGGSGWFSWTPDRLSVRCMTLDNLIRDAYLSYPDGKPWVPATRLEPSPEAFGVNYGGGCLYCGRGVPPLSQRAFNQPIAGSPAWGHTERFLIDAKAPAPTTPEMMRGPMMQALLAERFNLKLRRDSRELQVYELTVAPGGTTLQRAQEKSCSTGPASNDRAPAQAPPRICGRGGVQTPGGNDYWSPGTTIARLCQNLSAGIDREVIDKTGITGTYDIQLDAHVVTLPDLSAAPPVEGMPPRPPEIDHAATLKLFQAALQKVGLKLSPAMGKGVVLVIDHVERPSRN